MKKNEVFQNWQLERAFFFFDKTAPREYQATNFIKHCFAPSNLN